MSMHIAQSLNALQVFPRAAVGTHINAGAFMRLFVRGGSSTESLRAHAPKRRWRNASLFESSPLLRQARSVLGHTHMSAWLGALNGRPSAGVTSSACSSAALSANTSVERTFFHSRCAALKKRRSPLRWAPSLSPQSGPRVCVSFPTPRRCLVA